MFDHFYYDKNKFDSVIGYWGTKVETQGKSPWVGGKLVLKPNALGYMRWKNVYSAYTGFQDKFWDGRFTPYSSIRPSDAPVNWEQLSAIHRSIIVETGNKFHDEVAGIRVNLLDLYRTRVESMNMVVKNINKLVHAYRLLKKGKWRQFCRTLGISSKRPKGKGKDNIPALWLEYSFGWAPLLSDIYTILDEPFEVPGAFIRKVFRKTLPYSGVEKSDYEETYLQGNLVCRGVAVGYVYVDVPAVKALSSYGVTNPTAVLWESLPFSFVVDWFAPVGDFLNSLGATAGLKFLDYNITSTITTNLNGLARKRTDTWEKTWATGGQNLHSKSKVRTLFDKPEWIYPGNDTLLDLSLRRTSYALALLSSVFGGRKK